MKPISNTALPLNSIMSRNEFMDWFFNLNGTQNILYELSNQTSNGFTIPLGVYSSNASILNLINQVMINLPAATNIGVILLTQFFGMIYDIFKEAIPYNQTTITTNQVSITNETYQATVLDYLMSNIAGYINVYLPNIMSWFYNVNRMMYANSQLLNNKGTRSVSKTQGINNVSQNQNISKVSFNPVDTNSTITTNKINVNTQANGGLQTEQFTASDSANWSTDTNGSSSSINRDETITEIDLTQLRELGSEKAIQYLVPLFKKIGTLFWQLGNDQWNENYEILGFKIW